MEKWLETCASKAAATEEASLDKLDLASDKIQALKTEVIDHEPLHKTIITEVKEISKNTTKEEMKPINKRIDEITKKYKVNHSNMGAEKKNTTIDSFKRKKILSFVSFQQF